MRQLLHALSGDNLVLFHLWWRKIVLKLKKVCKCFVQDCDLSMTSWFINWIWTKFSKKVKYFYLNTNPQNGIVSWFQWKQQPHTLIPLSTNSTKWSNTFPQKCQSLMWLSNCQIPTKMSSVDVIFLYIYRYPLDCRLAYKLDAWWKPMSKKTNFIF